MSKRYEDALNVYPDSLRFVKQLKESDASSIFEVEVHDKRYAMKLFHDNSDPGFAKNGRDLNRFRCELNAYSNLSSFGVCERKLVPYYYGYIDRLDPASFQPHLGGFMNDIHHPRAILLEYLQDIEELHSAINGLREIHRSLIHHHDIYPKNILISMGHLEEEICEEEIQVVESFGDLLREDQRQGLPPNTKYY
ncbi:hypothetical protein BDV32DRAFT_134106 [Aspergillus pseudonomiae]|uniref:Uncharacterized protein n=1 Tax=Aspergillus pseudonomiae TaxID=1506151 RepID=A0A5N7DSA4_9EURO|nr:uncharacterized protein BDV37DRAFT_268095 [Aspergillus pseudonomiae]KAB8266033.1 hypothetical protein BDV32DRAFT_134106 [Aspergillus pseudonomiae]KAE8408899.1 hypothetical protein BDV37DRAFT_268095 [Aspergillus pseudonomiae]